MVQAMVRAKVAGGARWRVFKKQKQKKGEKIAAMGEKFAADVFEGRRAQRGLQLAHVGGGHALGRRAAPDPPVRVHERPGEAPRRRAAAALCALALRLALAGRWGGEVGPPV